MPGKKKKEEEVVLPTKKTTKKAAKSKAPAKKEVAPKVEATPKVPTYTTVHGRKIKEVVELPKGILQVVDVEGSIYRLPESDAKAFLA